MTFEEWLEETKGDMNTLAACELARAAWDSAIDEAVKVAESTWQDPNKWITTAEQIKELKE